MLKLLIGDFPEGEKPIAKSMLTAVTNLYFLLLFQLAWGIWQLVMLFTQHLHAPSAILPFTAMLATVILSIVSPFIITYWLAEKIKQGQRWARVIYTIVALGYCGLLLYSEYLKCVQGISSHSLVFFLQWYLSFSPICFLFQKDSNEWFKQASQQHANPTQERESA